MQLQYLHQTRPVHRAVQGVDVSRVLLHSLASQCKPSALYSPTAAVAVHVALHDSSTPRTPGLAALAGVSSAPLPARGPPGLTDQSEQNGCVTSVAQHAGQQLGLSAANPMQPRWKHQPITLNINNTAICWSKFDQFSAHSVICFSLKID